MSKIQNEDLKKVFAYIDEHIDEHVQKLQKWIRQPSISNSGEGIPESAEMVKGFFEELGCQESRVYDVGITEWGSPGNPVVYARCNEGAPRTVAIYWQYDTMPITQPDAWIAPPFEGRLIEQAPYKKVLIGRGATNSKGPQMAQFNALMSLFLISFRLASRALARNTLRTVLTMLGMIIGVGAVVTMAALGNGAQQSVETDVRSAGTNLVQVRAGNFTRGGEDSNIASGLGAATTLVIDDADAIRKEIHGLKRVAEVVRLRAWVASGGKRFYAQVAGTGADLPPIYGWPLAGGRFYDARDVAARARVALLGATVQDRLFEPSGGVGSTVTIRDQPFKVVGLPRTTDEDQNETVYVPFTALQDILSVTYLHGITIEAEQSGDATRVAADITALLRRRHVAECPRRAWRMRANERLCSSAALSPLSCNASVSVIAPQFIARRK